MSRRIPPPSPELQKAIAAATPEVTGAPPAQMLGGSPGYLPPNSGYVEHASTRIHFPGVPEFDAAKGDAPEEPAKVTRFRVTNAPRVEGRPRPAYQILVRGVLSYLWEGKVVDSTTYDLEDLRKQNVDLEPIDGSS